MGRTVVTLVGIAVASVAVAGDEFQLPVLRGASSYESMDPAYLLVGIEDRGAECRAWVVASPETVLSQRSVNRIIVSLYKHAAPSRDCPRPTEIYFYSAVRKEPQYPAFRITDILGTYTAHENKTSFSSGEKTYGGWAYGPASMRPNNALERQRGQ